MEKLTEKEIEVLNCIKTGMTNKETAQKLGISVSAVKSRITASITKLNARNRINAIYKAYLLKYLE